MTAITQNLPWFIKDLGVSIVGQECYTSLVQNLHITDVKCLKYSLSKGLGVGIVAGGSIMKIPQILLITSARSARGLSLESYLLETTAYGINLAYNVRHAFPFTTYGENLFLTLQNVLITLLIIAYAPIPRALTNASPKDKSQTLALAGVGIAFVAFMLCIVPEPLLALLQLGTLPLSLFSKLPQIKQNWRSKSTGQLSAFAVGSQIAGCAARVFTTAQEVGDVLVLAGYVLALGLNGVLALQLWMYWGDVELDIESSAMIREKERGGERRGMAPWDAHVSGSAGVGHHHAVNIPLVSRGVGIDLKQDVMRAGSTPPLGPPMVNGERKVGRKVD